MDLVTFISSSMDRALDGLSLDPADKRRISAVLTKRAFDMKEVKAKFNYSLQDSRYLSRTPGEILSVVRQSPTSDSLDETAKFTEPRFARVRNPKPVRINVRYKISDVAKRLFANNYGKEVELNVIDEQPHDHAVAAVSRRIEMDLMLQDLWQRGCDVLSVPTNYDFSVIDIGGDWRIADERKHHGMHVCAPMLSARDEAREARKRMANPRPTVSYCKSKFQDCKASAPFGVSLHSCYDITHEQLCHGMLKRSMKLVVGTMLLPEELEDVHLTKSMSYVDPIFQMEVAYTGGATAMKYIPPALRKGVAKYIDASRSETVTYRFMNGASVPYVHEYKTLLSYLHAKRISVQVNGRSYEFDYTINRRVGSLIYFSMTQIQDEQLPFAQRYISRVVASPFDGYVLKADPNLINVQTTVLDAFQTIYIPRLLFDYVAVYCMTKVGTPDFTVDSVLAYTKSAMTRTRINEFTVDLAGSETSTEVMIATSVVAYKWAHDRVKLLNARVPHSAYLKIREGAVNNIVKVLEKAVDTTALLDLVKSGIADLVLSMVTQGKFTSLGEKVAAEAENIYNLIAGALTMGVVLLEDCNYMVAPIMEMTDQSIDVNKSSSQIISYQITESEESVINPPEFPDYSQTNINPSISNARSNKKISRSIERLVTSEMEKSRNIPINDIDSQHAQHLRIIQDTIDLHVATQQEAEDSAMTMLKRTLTDGFNRISDLTEIQALQKGAPVVIRIYDDTVTQVTTLDKGVILRDSLEFPDLLDQFFGKRFGTLSMRGENPLDWKPVWFVLGKDSFPNGSIGFSYDAIMLPGLQIVNAQLLRPLERKLCCITQCAATQCETVLVDGVAGCGKTEEQSNEYIHLQDNGDKPLVLTATNVAAQQVIERVTMKLSKRCDEITYDGKMKEIHCMTIDSFMMHSIHWELNVTHILLDEALQMHAGKIYAAIELTSPRMVKAYGDSKQIGFINFSKLKTPSVITTFPYSLTENRTLTWRIPRGPRIKMLQSDILYAKEFDTRRTSDDKLLVLGKCKGLMGILTVQWLYNTLKLHPSDQLLILVYRADIADDLRMRFNITRDFPSVEAEYNVALSTIGESQGNDVDHAILLRLSSRDEPLFQQPSQTIVALTRSKISWSYLAVPSIFPSLIETLLDSVNLKLTEI